MQIKLRIHRLTMPLLVGVSWIANHLSASQTSDQIIPYKKVSEVSLNLFILKPTGGGQMRPGLLYFHGGGWNNGTAESSLGFLKHFCEAGFVCASVEYRCRDTHGGTTPMDATRDARSALRAFAAHAKDLGVDPQRIFVGGASAGGHLACMTALGAGLGEPDEEKAPAPHVAALLLWNPVVDTTDQGYGGTKRFGALTEKYSPVHLLRKDSPPVLVQHGTVDKTAPYENAQRFIATAEKLGIQCKLVTYPGAGHSFYAGQENREKLQQSYREADAFLKSLNLRASSTSQPMMSSNDKTTQSTAAAGASTSMPTFDVAATDRERILKAAAAALTLAPLTITQFQTAHSSGGPNDFFSQADYYWPDPRKTNGLPYMQRDGETNPANFNEHRMAIRRLRDAVAALGAAYKLTGEDRYAQKAAELLRVFFLDPARRMNPHLEYAQAILGKSPGRSFGIIDALHLIEIPPAIMVMQRSPAFTPELVAGLKKWFSDLSDWMITSKNGREEAAAKNNHSVAYWLQIAVFASFTGDEKLLAECRRQFKEVFVPMQMAPDGSFPFELKRTKPYGYSIFQLDNMTTLCQVLSTPEDDLWKFTLPDGRGIRKAITYLYPFLADKSKWPLKPDVMAWDGWPARQINLLFGGLAYGEQKYLGLWQKLPADPTDSEVQRNIAITQPLLWLK